MLLEAVEAAPAVDVGAGTTGEGVLLPGLGVAWLSEPEQATKSTVDRDNAAISGQLKREISSLTPHPSFPEPHP